MDRSSVLYQAMPAVGADGKNIMKLIPVIRNNGQSSPAQLVIQRSDGQSRLTRTPVQIFNTQSVPTVLKTNGLSHPPQKPVRIVNGQFLPTQIPVQIITPQSIPVQIVNGQPVPTHAPVLKTNGQSFLTATPQTVFTVLQSAPPRIISRPGSAGNLLPNQMNSPSEASLNKLNPQQQTVNSVAKTPWTGSPLVGRSVEVSVPVTSPTLHKSEVQNIPTKAQFPGVSAFKDQPIKDQILSPSASFSAKSSSPTVIFVSPVTAANQKVTQPICSAAERLQELSVKVSTCDSLDEPAESQLFNRDAPPKTGSAPKLKLIPKVSNRPNSPTRWVIEEMGSSSAADSSRKPRSSEPAPSGKLHSFSKKENIPDQTLPGNSCVMYDGRLFYGTKKGSSSSQSSAATHLVPSSSVQPAGALTDEVIDLCGDDSSPSSDMPAVSHADEDNVIFVSYVPPKSKPDSVQKNRMGCGSSSSRTEVSPGGEWWRGQSASVRRDAGVCGPAESLNPKRLMGTPEQQLDNLEMDAGKGSSAVPSEEQRAPTGQRSDRRVHGGTSLAPSEPCHKSDHQLRTRFGITADIRICLHKIDEMPHWCASANFLQTKFRVQGNGGQMSRAVFKVKEASLCDISSPYKLDVQVRTEPEQMPSSHALTLRGPEKRVNSKPQCVSKENCCSGLEMSFLPEAESGIGYVEPIDEDFPDESDIPQFQDAPVHPQTQTCGEVNTNTRRMGRTRKRTMCPCCIPTILLPVIKSAAKLEEAERWTSAAERTNRRGGRTKAARKYGKTS